MAKDALSEFADAARLASSSLFDYLSGFTQPTLKLGVTGLSRAGKTVFITSLVHALIAGGRLPVFRALAEGRISRAVIAHQPDDAVPRFAYEDHIATLTAPDRAWPDSTRQISQIRLELEFERPKGWFSGGKSSLAIDIIDYPGEWLLDLPLLEMSFAEWSRSTLAAARQGARQAPFAAFIARLATIRPDQKADEKTARELAELFTAALVACRQEGIGLSSLPPGRFLMPGDLAGSPALTFAPLDLPSETDPASASLQAMMARRFEAYKSHVVRPFFRDHFARLDRQIVLVDVLSAINAGREALGDLEKALADVLGAFRVGQNSLLSSIFSPKIDKVLFAATKADHLHHTDHDRLEAALRMLTRRALTRVQGAGSELDVVALAAVRATREVEVRRGRELLPCIAGIPIAGERLGDEIFDGEREAALYPGELPTNAIDLFDKTKTLEPVKFLRFRPPKPQFLAGDLVAPLPHIRLDQALEFLLGDRLG
jgi:predicted YcjX-like family ATPase